MLKQVQHDKDFMNKKYLVGILLLIIVLLIGLTTYDYFRFNDHKLHVVFCNVGQGDAIFIRSPKGKNILVDGGPDKSVLSCLSRHLPFWERNIDLIFLTHPHEDHLSGIHYVIDRYIAKYFVTEKVANNTPGYKLLLDRLKIHNLDIKYVYTGDKFTTTDGLNIIVRNPAKSFLENKTFTALISESKEVACLVLQISYGDFDVLLTADSQAENLTSAISSMLSPIEILQVPHHGSRFGLNEEIADRIDPKLAVISVGKNNYGHPSKEILKILGDKEIKILSTDKKGDIEMVSDGKGWGVVGQ